jgi:flavin reductase (DIM6/NTAB) family NADH-FMN oxidoreductase RutF
MAKVTLGGIEQNRAFSVNLPSAAQVKETDYCGTVSGAKADKAGDCRFQVFYGQLAHAPLIDQCPVNLECSVVQILDLGSHCLIIGQIAQTHVSEHCLTDGRPNVEKIQPLAYVTSPAARYQKLGEVAGKAWSAGRHVK